MLLQSPCVLAPLSALTDLIYSALADTVASYRHCRCPSLFEDKILLWQSPLSKTCDGEVVVILFHLRYACNFDLVSWKMTLEKRQLPEADRKQLYFILFGELIAVQRHQEVRPLLLEAHECC
ncbi:hypothetical protein RIF29_28146 [Crotalaria pallida]|uniref:Uncharacterized protein n=1 Tax=Crotalaria pallida TaxID=3830 RepID=A0AAN9EV75_CROPI